jgi:DNA-binding NarL/FixJ family response regulator
VRETVFPLPLGIFQALTGLYPMTRKKKQLNQSVASVAPRAVKAASLSESLRSLINGLFADKPYKPTLQQIADYYLTPREREIAYLAALGFSIQEIADALGMNFQTVRQHLRHILTKMELNDPRELREFFLPRSGDE